jgi:hypothetical protein
MHLLGDSSRLDDSDSNATKLGKLLYWNKLPQNVPYGDNGMRGVDGIYLFVCQLQLLVSADGFYDMM